MNEEEAQKYEGALIEYLKARVSRAQMLAAAGAGLALAAVPGAAGAAGPGGAGTGPGLSFPFYPQVPGTYTPENAQDILNIAVTSEHLAATFLTAGVNNAAAIGLAGPVLNIVQATLAEEVYHAQFLEGLGAKSLNDNFSVPDPKMLSDYATFFRTIELGDALFNAAYMTATREFSELGQPTLAKFAFQIGSVEAEHRALARAALALRGIDAVPPNNKAFETDLFVYVRDVVAVVTDLGFTGNGAIKASYPGTAAALAAAGPMAAAVVQKTPNNATSSVGSNANLGGARGETFTTMMTGMAEIPPGDPNGSGVAMITLDLDNNQVAYQITVSGIQLPATAAHIHKGAPGVEGPVVVPLGAPGSNGSASGVVNADPAILRDIEANPGNYYVNVHNKPYPGGAVRGQL